MIKDTFKDVLGEKHIVRITPEWGVTFDEDRRKKFTSLIGPLIVATIVSNFDIVTEKTDIKQLALDTYLELLERGYAAIDPSPTEYTQKEIGDKFDAFIRKRDLPLRQNVYHIGMLGFRKIAIFRDPTNLLLVEELFEGAVSDDVSEQGKLAIIDSYNLSYFEKMNKHIRGIKKPSSSASDETLDRLSRGLVDVSTRATRRNTSSLSRTVSDQTKATDRTEILDKLRAESDTEFTPYAEFSDVTEYGQIAYRHLDALRAGRVVSEIDMKRFLELRGFNASTEDISNILIFAARNRLGTIKETDRSSEGELRRITFVRK